LSLLEIKDLRVYYGKAVAIQGVSISLDRGEALAVIGPNGAGKTTLLRSIAGLVPSQGGIRFEGKDISSLPAFQIARRRITLCPEGRKLFPELTVRQNLDMGGYRRKDRALLKKDLERAYELFPVLKARQGLHFAKHSPGQRGRRDALTGGTGCQLGPRGGFTGLPSGERSNPAGGLLRGNRGASPHQGGLSGHLLTSQIIISGSAVSYFHIRSDTRMAPPWSARGKASLIFEKGSV
jgi:ABC-type transport system involved in cytochrome c biogenesis ATPase subunit